MKAITYGHRSQKTEDPVRSPVLKLQTGGLVLRWVTTWEYPLLYVLYFFSAIILLSGEERKGFHFSPGSGGLEEASGLVWRQLA